MKIIIWLDGPRCRNTDLAGGKGASLCAMLEGGFDVPPGFVITAPAFSLFLKAAGIGRQIDELTVRLADTADIESIADVSAEIEALIMSAPLPPDFETEILSAYDSLGRGPVAVRSSATVEDAATAAWAGQFSSWLNINGDSLVEAVKKCWASLYSPAAFSYRLGQTDRTGDIEDAKEPMMAVVVQEMVQADFSGVAFSINPASGDKNHVLIESTAGTAENLVAGRISPDRCLIDKDSLSPEAGSGGLSATDLSELARLVIAIEEYLNHPVDVEWVRTGRRWRIVQARPVSAMTKRDGDKEIWSNMNIAEVLPGVIPPLVCDYLIDIVDPAIRKIRLFKFPPGRPIAAPIKGRLYFNLTTFEKGLSKVLAAKTEDLNFTQLLGGEQEEKSIAKKLNWRARILILFFLVRIVFDSLMLRRRFRNYVVKTRASAESDMRSVVKTEALPDLLALQSKLNENVARFVITGFHMVASPLSYLFVFQAVSRRWLGEGANSLALLATGGEGFQPVEAFSDLWTVRDRIKRDPALTKVFLNADSTEEALAAVNGDVEAGALFKRFMEIHGHRCAKELDFSLPRWSEDPTFIIHVLKNYLIAPDEYDPADKARAVKTKHEKILSEILPALPRWKRIVIRKVLKMAAGGQQKRENLKFEMVRLLAPIRANLLKIGNTLKDKGLLDKADDVFMLRINELFGSPPAGLPLESFLELAAKRKSQYLEYEQLDLPPVITDLDNLPVGTANRPETPAENRPGKSPKDTKLRGIAVSGGIVRGRVKLIRSIGEIGGLKPGDILLTDHTDPGWTPVFATIKGLIANTGGLASHTSIVAREYGLPAVVNVIGATELIEDGCEVLLDGDKGIIRRFPSDAC